MAQRIYQVRHQFGVDVISTLDTYHTQIADQLTPEHKAAYLAATAERHRQLSLLLGLDESSPPAGQK
ncbi:MAG: hypothetical protein WDO13_13015 [Verrucomicrobiota bacterium]